MKTQKNVRLVNFIYLCYTFYEIVNWEYSHFVFCQGGKFMKKFFLVLLGCILAVVANYYLYVKPIQESFPAGLGTISHIKRKRYAKMTRR